MVNSNAGGRLLREILLAVGSEYNWPNYAEVEARSVPVAELKQYEGLYVVAQPFLTLSLTLNGDVLFAEQRGVPTSEEVVFTGPDRAVTLSSGMEMAFHRDPAGSVEGFDAMSVEFARLQ